MYVRKHPYPSYRECPVCGRNIRLKGFMKRRKKRKLYDILVTQYP